MNKKPFRHPATAVKGAGFQEAAGLDQPGLTVNVRAAKDRLSSLLEAAARGDEVVITSDGRPKARLVGVVPRRRPFRMPWAWLRAQPLSAGPWAEELVREDRDGRG